MQSRPLKILVADEHITKTYLVLERICPTCKGTGLKYPELTTHSPPCNSCAGGYTTTSAGKAILQLVVLHLVTLTQYGGSLKPTALHSLSKETLGE